MTEADYDKPLLPVRTWNEIQTALEEEASTPVHRAMVRHLLGGLRDHARFLTTAGFLRELSIITLTVMDELGGDGSMPASP